MMKKYVSKLNLAYYTDSETPLESFMNEYYKLGDEVDALYSPVKNENSLYSRSLKVFLQDLFQFKDEFMRDKKRAEQPIRAQAKKDKLKFTETERLAEEVSRPIANQYIGKLKRMRNKLMQINKDYK